MAKNLSLFEAPEGVNVGQEVFEALGLDILEPKVEDLETNLAKVGSITAASYAAAKSAVDTATNVVTILGLGTFEITTETVTGASAGSPESAGQHDLDLGQAVFEVSSGVFKLFRNYQRREGYVRASWFGTIGSYATLQTAADFAYAANIRTVLIDAGQWNFGANTFGIYNSTKYIFEGKEFANNYIRNDGSLPVVAKHSSIGSGFLSKAELHNAFFYPNSDASAVAVLNCDTWSQCLVKRAYFFNGHTAIKLGANGSDVDFQDTIIEHFDNIFDTTTDDFNFTQATFTNCTFIEDFGGAGRGSFKIPKTIYQNSNTRNFGMQFINCWWERCNIDIDAANIELSGIIMQSNTVLGKHSSNCNITATQDSLTSTIMDLGWNNRIFNANGQNCSGMPTIHGKRPPIGTLSKIATVTANTEYLVMASLMSKETDVIDDSAIAIRDNSNNTQLYLSEAANVYARGGANNEFFNKSRQFGRFTLQELITTPTGCTALKVTGWDSSAEAGNMVDTFIWPNLLTNGDLKNGDGSAYQNTGWTSSLITAGSVTDGYSALTLAANARLYQTVTGLELGATYMLVCKYKNNVGGVRLALFGGNFTINDNQNILLNLLNNAQTGYQNDSGYIANGFFQAMTTSVTVALTNFQASSIDLAWVGLIKL